MLKHISLGAPARMTDNGAMKKHAEKKKKKKEKYSFWNYTISSFQEVAVSSSWLTPDFVSQILSFPP